MSCMNVLATHGPVYLAGVYLEVTSLTGYNSFIFYNSFKDS